jgi:hypothetical protein
MLVSRPLPSYASVAEREAKSLIDVNRPLAYVNVVSREKGSVIFVSSPLV